MLKWAASQVEQLDSAVAAKAPRQDDLLPSIADEEFEGRAYSSASANIADNIEDIADLDPEAVLPEAFLKAEQSVWSTPELKLEFQAALETLRDKHGKLGERARRNRELRGTVSRSSAVYAQELTNLRTELRATEQRLAEERGAHATTLAQAQARGESLAGEEEGYRKAMVGIAAQAEEKRGGIARLQGQLEGMEMELPALEEEVRALEEQLREEQASAPPLQAVAEGGAPGGGGLGESLVALEQEVAAGRAQLAEAERELAGLEREAARLPGAEEREEGLRRRLAALEDQFRSKQASAASLERDRSDLARQVEEVAAARRQRQHAASADRVKRNKIGRDRGSGDVEMGRGGVRQRAQAGGGGGAPEAPPGAAPPGKKGLTARVQGAANAVDALSLFAGRTLYRLSWLRPVLVLYIAGLHLVVFLILSARSLRGI